MQKILTGLGMHQINPAAGKLRLGFLTQLFLIFWYFTQIIPSKVKFSELTKCAGANIGEGLQARVEGDTNQAQVYVGLAEIDM
jgi:hypothetical protein